MKIERAMRWGDEPLAQVRSVEVDLLRGRSGPVDVRVDDRLPLIFEVLRQVRVHGRRIERNVAGQDQRRGVIGRPQLVHDRRDELQHTAGALEPLQRRPVDRKSPSELQSQ